MSSTYFEFWKDERGFVATGELTMISTVLVLSFVVGMTGLSQTMNEELATMSNSTNASLPMDRYSSLGIDSHQNLPQAPAPAITVSGESTSG